MFYNAGDGEIGKSGRQTSVNTYQGDKAERAEEGRKKKMEVGSTYEKKHLKHSNQSHAGKFIRHFLCKCSKHNQGLFLQDYFNTQGNAGVH